MIRLLQKADIDRVSDIWLDANRKAHHFIPTQYWQSNYDAVKEMQSQGIGKRLLDFVKDKKAELCLNVYQKYIRAINFYQREGFEIQCEGLDEATGEKDYAMVWKRKRRNTHDRMGKSTKRLFI